MDHNKTDKESAMIIFLLSVNILQASTVPTGIDIIVGVIKATPINP